MTSKITYKFYPLAGYPEDCPEKEGTLEVTIEEPEKTTILSISAKIRYYEYMHNHKEVA